MDARSVQKKFYNYIKEKAINIEWKRSKELTEYQQNFIKLTNSKFSFTSESKLKEEITNAQIVFLGDFHSFDQNARNLQRIIKSLDTSGKRIIFGMEFINFNDQIYVDHYLDGHLTELEFLEKINYSESWKFPWAHYRVFFEWAKRRRKLSQDNIIVDKIVALNSIGPLKKRDQVASRIVTNTLLSLADPQNTIFFIFFGEMHLANNKLPHEVHSNLIRTKLKNIKSITIHQNIDKLFWKIKKTGPQILKLKNGDFCIQSSPPWVKYESLLYWHEHLEDDPDFDIHEFLRENHKNVVGNDSDIIHDTLKKLNSCFQFKNSKIDFDFNLYGPANLNVPLRKVERLPSHLRPVYKELISKGILLRIPGTTDIFSTSYSMNKVAAICGLIFSYHLSEGTTKAHESLLAEKSLYKYSLFYLLLKEHFISECCKLIYNPYAKCDLYLDFLKFSKDSKIPKDRKKSYELTLKILNNNHLLTSENPKIVSRSAVLLAKMYAYSLYNFNKNKLSKVVHMVLFQEMGATNQLNQMLKTETLAGQDFKRMSKNTF